MKAAAARTAERSLTALDPLRDHGGDLRAALEQAALEILRAHTCRRAQALRRLLGALADRLARLTLADRLHTPDPDQASEQLLALLTGPMELRSALGTRPVPDDDLHAVARAAVATFLTAYGPREGAERPSAPGGSS
ncbi:TetR/AcrR family transcriptional regulator C-terminal domain-containing protein [Nocardiopsis halophila]|uniref:TetR/AcrR family transcriptional regulator C-terminal domain-containing protein n=1 Tax=Nocardiopsis halophila TaxID=141692 RepID=UPI000345CD82|nr:TetR/AcrR family transcriptional regulator C-terminal domain-containing protein [Nocardiopsis halophila]